jgi:hypothetical protein
MKFNYFGKLSMLILALIIQTPILGVILCVTIGHILDIRWQSIVYYFENKNQYQKTSENMLLLLAYNCKLLALDSNKAAKILQQETMSKHPKNDHDLFLYYTDEYIPQKLKKVKFFDYKMSQAMLTIKNNKPDSANNCLIFFNLIEAIFNNQKPNPTAYEIEKLKEIGKTFNINYIRNNEFENTKQENTTYTYNNPNNSTNHKNSNADYKSNDNNEKNENIEEKSSYISQEIKDSLENLGFNHKKLPLIEDVKKAYKAKVIKCHPDILKGKNASDNTIKKAGLELTKLNKSMDIVKKFLANQ